MGKLSVFLYYESSLYIGNIENHMTSVQRRLLRSVFFSVAHHDGNLWWELKREIFDDGYQSQYHWALDFIQPAERALKMLSVTDRATLVAEWKKTNSDGIERTEEVIFEIYAAIVVEEVVRRAAIASNRTITW